VAQAAKRTKDNVAKRPILDVEALAEMPAPKKNDSWRVIIVSSLRYGMNFLSDARLETLVDFQVAKVRIHYREAIYRLPGFLFRHMVFGVSRMISLFLLPWLESCSPKEILSLRIATFA